MAVCPVPIPKNTLPGAIVLIEAIEQAVSGAIRAGNCDTGANFYLRGVLQLKP